MKVWLDDLRPAPDGYVWCKSVNEAKKVIIHEEVWHEMNDIGLPTKADIEIDIDHDASIYANDGGDYIKLLDWLEETERSYPIRIHSQNPVGIANMRRIIQRNGWKEVF